MQKQSSSEVGPDSPVMKQAEEKRVRETPPVPDPNGKVSSNNKGKLYRNIISACNILVAIFRK